MRKFLIIAITMAIVIPFSAMGKDVGFNISSLPFNSSYEVSIDMPQEDLPTIVSISYDPWLIGVATLDFDNITLFKKTNVSISIPEGIVDGNYTRIVSFNSTRGKRLQIGFNFDILTNKTANTANISIPGLKCDYSKNPPVCTFEIVATPQTPQEKLITIYNTTSVVSCQDLYVGDYASLSAKYNNTNTEYLVLQEQYRNLTRILEKGCDDEQLAIENCYQQKHRQELITGVAIDPAYCLGFEQNKRQCEQTRLYWREKAVNGLGVTPTGYLFVAAFAFVLIVVMVFISAFYSSIKRKFAGVG